MECLTVPPSIATLRPASPGAATRCKEVVRGRPGAARCGPSSAPRRRRLAPDRGAAQLPQSGERPPRGTARAASKRARSRAWIGGTGVAGKAMCDASAPPIFRPDQSFTGAATGPGAARHNRRGRHRLHRRGRHPGRPRRRLRRRRRWRRRARSRRAPRRDRAGRRGTPRRHHRERRGRAVAGLSVDRPVPGPPPRRAQPGVPAAAQEPGRGHPAGGRRLDQHQLLAPQPGGHASVRLHHRDQRELAPDHRPGDGPGRLARAPGRGPQPLQHEDRGRLRPRRHRHGLRRRAAPPAPGPAVRQRTRPVCGREAPRRRLRFGRLHRPVERLRQGPGRRHHRAGHGRGRPRLRRQVAVDKRPRPVRHQRRRPSGPGDDPQLPAQQLRQDPADHGRLARPRHTLR